MQKPSTWPPLWRCRLTFPPPVTLSRLTQRPVARSKRSGLNQTRSPCGTHGRSSLWIAWSGNPISMIVANPWILSVIAYLLTTIKLLDSLRLCVFALRLVSLRLQPFLEIGFDLLRPCAVDLARCVTSFVQALLAEDITCAHILRPLDDFLRKMRRDEDHPRRRPKDDVARQDRRLADADRNIDACQGDVGNRRRMEPAAEDRTLGQLAYTLEVTNAALDHRAGSRAGVQRGREIVADKGSILDLAEHIHDHDVARLKRIDHPRVLPADASLFPATLFDQCVEIGPVGHHLGGHRPANQDLVRVGLEPAAFELKVVAMSAQNAPGLFGRDQAHALDQVVGNARPSVREALEWVQPCQLDQGVTRVDDMHACSLFKGPRSFLQVCAHDIRFPPMIAGVAKSPAARWICSAPGRMRQRWSGCCRDRCVRVQRGE